MSRRLSRRSAEQADRAANLAVKVDLVCKDRHLWKPNCSKTSWLLVDRSTRVWPPSFSHHKLADPTIDGRRG